MDRVDRPDRAERGERAELLPPEWLQDRLLTDRLLDALWSARQPATPSQFFVWSQSRLQALLPHQALVCLGEQGPSARWVARLFHLKPLPASLQAQLEAPDHGLWQHLMRRWAPGRRALMIRLAQEPATSPLQALAEAGLPALLMHGVVHEDGRPAGLCLLAGDGWSLDQAQVLELLTPTLQATWKRAATADQPAPQRRMASLVTPREQQIVEGLRAGLSNEGIAIQLGISMFTVKNHVRKILRKLGAANRAQAVAIAMARREVGGI